MTDVFGNRPGRTHRDDPWTSKTVAANILGRTGSLREQVLRALQTATRDPDRCGATDFELAELLNRRPTSTGTRRKELQEFGLVVDTGDTRPSPWGNAAIVWAVDLDETHACLADRDGFIPPSARNDAPRLF